MGTCLPRRKDHRLLFGRRCDKFGEYDRPYENAGRSAHAIGQKKRIHETYDTHGNLQEYCQGDYSHVSSGGIQSFRNARDGLYYVPAGHYRLP